MKSYLLPSFILATLSVLALVAMPAALSNPHNGTATTTSLTSIPDTPYLANYPGPARLVDGSAVHAADGDIRLCFRVLVSNELETVRSWYAAQLSQNGWSLAKNQTDKSMAAMRGSTTCAVYLQPSRLKALPCEVVLYYSMRP